MSRTFVIAMGLVLGLAGAYAIWLGYPIIEVERGWAQVIGGAAALSGGVVTLAIGLLIGAVDRLRRALPIAPPAPAVAAYAPEPADPAPVEWVDRDEATDSHSVDTFERAVRGAMDEARASGEAAPASAVAIENAPARVLGRYAFGGDHYTLYEDGSIEAETEEGVTRFASLDELRRTLGDKGLA